MHDLNDLHYFAAVVTHGGFAAASRAIRLPKSKLSRRVAQLEDRLGVRLIERSSRRFRVTEIGNAFFEQAQAAMKAAERAEAIVAASISEPRGLIRFACPTGLVEIVSPLLPDFLTLYPRARIQLVAVDRPVDLIAERIDVALRVRVKLDTDAAMTMRTIGRSRRILLAAPALANILAGRDVDALADVPTLATSDEGPDVTWTLEGPDGAVRAITHVPRLGCDNFAAVRDAAIAGLGVAFLPDHACAAALRSGDLVRVMPHWRGQDGIVHLVFTTKVGLPPLVRAWIDHLAASIRSAAIFG
ncbi:LysR family transcriptional regulator [Sphingomonas crocodyli]|uniref:LysR family transcriptional regulator n=1 Tax=Sphingomonas crocodyli TaxID=1979270 RepID=A0A437LVM4_9SPHN|nr:LysR family transcriptional regulator [Sphingomonas crocodyli]RVT89436.1 LysR family transcriptional regulator [Sphingomonas crocodyli]